MTDRNRVEVREADEPALDPAGPSSGSRPAVSAAPTPDLLQRRPSGPGPGSSGTSRSASWSGSGPTPTCPGVEAGGRVFLGSILTCGQCQPCTEGTRTSASTTCCTATTPSPGLRRAGRRAPDRRRQPHPAPARPAVGAGHGGRPLRLCPQRHRGPRHPPRRHRADPGAGPIGCWQAVMARDRGPDGCCCRTSTATASAWPWRRWAGSWTTPSSPATTTASPRWPN